MRDDLGEPVPVPANVSRVVSLVPSLTESIASVARPLLVGATTWCTHPADLDVARVRGTKNPDLNAIAALRPDLVVANQEENRHVDVARLRDRGIAVWVTDIRTVAQAIESLSRLFTLALRRPSPAWLDTAARVWSAPPPQPPRRAAVPIWRDPWMVVGQDTFTGDVLRLLGLTNVFGDSDERYPHTSVAEIAASGPDVVVLPDEPYRFSSDDGPEQFPAGSTRLVSGRLLTWYGPSLVVAREELSRQLA
ncbi:MAG TPA: helical backbone metal receptor [Jatrophihabitantaceae bacterium]|nr:helical backbone metal receptor [Jatrophihabitantaceae bacterium]